MNRAFGVLTLMMMAAVQQPSPPADVVGSIQGVVIDEDRKPISDANVYGIPEGRDLRNWIWVTADIAGKFTLQNFPVGNAYLHAFKESDGYANNFFAFYMNTARKPVNVEIKPGAVTSGVTIQLGPKAAYLKVNATDEKGVPVPVTCHLDRDGLPGPYSTSVGTDPRLVGGGFITGSMLVPPAPFRLTVLADGYEPWHYGRATYAGKAGLITLKSSQTLSLAVRLRKK